uniref:Uncharacterized protein n=1 Tax=Cacopsylla melanoneura TaxID=428564 RepID=A0A8D8VBW7_9HEMI
MERNYFLSLPLIKHSNHTQEIYLISIAHEGGAFVNSISQSEWLGKTFPSKPILDSYRKIKHEFNFNITLFIGIQNLNITNNLIMKKKKLHGIRDCVSFGRNGS